LVFHSSTITMMHGPINVRVLLECWKPTICISDVCHILHWHLFSS